MTTATATNLWADAARSEGGGNLEKAYGLLSDALGRLEPTTPADEAFKIADSEWFEAFDPRERTAGEKLQRQMLFSMIDRTPHDQRNTPIVELARMMAAMETATTPAAIAALVDRLDGRETA